MKDNEIPKIDKPTPRNEALALNVLKQMSAQEKYALADFWESDGRKALEKLLGIRQLQVAQSTLKSSPDHEYTREMRGRSLELHNVASILSTNLKDINKARAKTQKPAS